MKGDDTVSRYFSGYASAFDSIYSGNKNGFYRLIDAVFRKDMFQRMQLTLDSCGDPRGKSFLDVGCGSGRYPIELGRRGGSATGIDFAGPMVELAKKLALEANVDSSTEFVEGDFLSYPFADNFDVLTAIGFFDYTKDARPFLTRALKLTREKLIATFPRRWTWRMPLRKARLTMLRLPVYFYGRKQVEGLLNDAGFTLSRQVTLATSFWVEARPKE